MKYITETELPSHYVRVLPHGAQIGHLMDPNARIFLSREQMPGVISLLASAIDSIDAARNEASA